MSPLKLEQHKRVSRSLPCTMIFSKPTPRGRLDTITSIGGKADCGKFHARAILERSPRRNHERRNRTVVCPCDDTRTQTEHTVTGGRRLLAHSAIPISCTPQHRVRDQVSPHASQVMNQKNSARPQPGRGQRSSGVALELSGGWENEGS